MRKLKLYLIKPSKYDDEGYVIRHWRGVMPSNTLCVLHSLAEDARRRRVLGSVEIETYLLDDTVQAIPVDRICRAQRLPRTKVAVMLVGVQTNQFPRAADLARAFRRRGVEVWMGGFHVSGCLAMAPVVPPEIQELLAIGVTIVAGEVEGHWDELLGDIAAGTSRPIYNLINVRPDLETAPLPQPPRAYLQRFVGAATATLDTSRGCPFDCSFCCIINVQGRRMRCRDPQALLDAVRANYRRGIRNYFFTDDNFARNKHWEAIFDGLIRLREEEELPVTFMMQTDVLAYRLPNFVDKARRAGCGQVFLGIESLNPANLQAADKKQNSVETFREMAAVWHAAGIVTHAAYIIGFPNDTPDSVRADVRRLADELEVEQASFFMLGPIPGSRDHQRLAAAGAPLDPDLNRYDSFHPTMPHPRMSADEWYALYRECWRVFYNFENMRAILRRVSPERYWPVFLNFFWIKNAAEIEGEHPMITGFWRIKERCSRRPGFPVPGRWEHFWAQVREKATQLRQWLVLLMEMEELWLQTRPPTKVERNLLAEWQKLYSQQLEWIESLRLPELPLAGMVSGVAGAVASVETVARNAAVAAIGGAKSAGLAALGAVKVGGDALAGVDIAELRRLWVEWTHTVLPAFLQHRRDMLESSLANLRLSPTEFTLAFPNLWDRAPVELRDWVVRLEQYTRSLQVSRRPLDWFWLQVWHNLRQGKFWRVRPSLVVWNLLCDLALGLRFGWAVLTRSSAPRRTSAAR